VSYCIVLDCVRIDIVCIITILLLLCQRFSDEAGRIVTRENIMPGGKIEHKFGSVGGLCNKGALGALPGGRFLAVCIIPNLPAHSDRDCFKVNSNSISS
jgi:hypothetical protein